MADQSSIRLVDSPREASVSFAPPNPGTLGPRGRTPTHAPIAVGPGRAVAAALVDSRAEPGVALSYPIQLGKIQAPELRDETLARTRLLDWLDVKIHSRVVFVIADAGYGKTTLLADFSRRTRLRTIWYRLDEEDRDWVGFLSHLVAAGREFEPGFAPRTVAMLGSLDAGGPTRDEAMETLIAELPAIAGDGAALILDDFHLADESADIRSIARDLVTRGPERLSIVFASRRAPSVPVAKLRALGELAELGIADLRFSDAEMEQLFRETYGRPLEPDVLTELSRRTEGWAASLTLVQAALRERSSAETRAFVRGLSGARDELHDYLAEEVVGDLPAIQQQFLMRTSILQRVTPELAQVATGLTATEVQSMIGEAERLGMLGRRANRRSAEQRYHPLVREFLEERLLRELGAEGIGSLHAAVAAWAEPNDWRTAAHHYAACRRWPDVRRVLERHLETIVASGAFSAAADYIAMFPQVPESAAVEVVLSRVASREGDFDRAEQHAQRGAALAPDDDTVMGNLIAWNYVTGDLSTSRDLAIGLISSAKSSVMRDIATGIRLVVESAVDGDLGEAARYLEDLAERNRQNGHHHYEGVTLLNLSIIERARGNGDRMLAAASTAIELLSATSSGLELASARLAKAWALSWLGDLGQAREEFRKVGADPGYGSPEEIQYEHADVEAEFGGEDRASRLLEELRRIGASPIYAEMAHATEAMLSIRRGRPKEALVRLDGRRPEFGPDAGHWTRVLVLRAVAEFLVDPSTAARAANRAVTASEAQGADRYREMARLVQAALQGRLGAALVETPSRLLAAISSVCEVIVHQLDSLTDEGLNVAASQAALRPDRWRPTLRRALEQRANPSRVAAARLLDQVGERNDVPLLRNFAREPKRAPADRQLGRSLAHRLALRAVVHDLGRVHIRIGNVEIGAADIRRKVLALLCYLLTRPRFTATREEAMDALWPEMDPDAAINSLNQTVYFLRRVFEPEYSEETSAGYVRQESELIYLDRELIKSESDRCFGLISRAAREPLDEVVDELSRAYAGKFALDFAYEDWASDYRDSLHVGYLQVVEESVRKDISSGRFGRGMALARRALEVEPRHDVLEQSLLKLLKSSGSHSAAAEQYERYASLLRHDLGVEPPPIDRV